MVECQALEKKNATKITSSLVVLQDLAMPTAQLASCRNQALHNPFISKGFVSLSEDSEKIPINILKDIGVTQSLLVNGALPLSDSTATCTVQIQGIEVVNALLLIIYLNTNLVNRTVIFPSYERNAT